MQKFTLWFTSALIILSAFGAALLTLPVNTGTEVVFPGLPETKEPRMLPNDWIAKQKLYPHSGFNHQHYLQGLREAQALHDKAIQRGAEWQAAGPVNIGGRITDIAVHPDEPGTIYIGAASGGILKSTDGGLSWLQVFNGSPVVSIGALAIDLNNPDVLFAGTGEANASSFSFIGNGIYKSVDGGQNWEHKGLEESAYFGRILIDHSNSERVFAAACGTLFSPNEMRGIYRSTNGGNDWERVLFVSDSTAGVDIVQHPTNPDILYAAMWERMRGLTYRRSHGVTSGIYKSTDGGTNWTLLTNGLPAGDQKGRIGLAIAQNNPDIVYASIDRLEWGSSYATVFKTTNGGQNWTQTNDSQLSDMYSTFGWYFGQIRVDPQNDNRIYVLGVDLYRSDNGGSSYIQIGGYFNIDEIYVDNHATFIHPTNGMILHGNDGGLYKSNDFGNNWNKINNLPLTQFYAIAVDYLNPQRIYGGTQDNNTVRTWTGATNDWERILGGDGMYCLVDYTNSNIIYAESQWGNLTRSDDGGNNFNYIAQWSDRTNWSSPFVMHPTDPQTLYFGTYRVWKTTNRGNSWTPISNDLTRNLAASGFSTISTLAISNLNPNHLLAGSDDGRVHISTTGGLIWTDITAGLPLRWITRVAFDPFDQNTIYATVSGFRWDEDHPYVFKSNNLGQSWTGISSNLPSMPVNVIVPDPDREGWLYVGTDVGVFYTENSGAEWSSLMEGMAAVPVTDMKLHQPTRTLVAGTYGNSAYRLNLDLVTGTTAQQAVADDKLQLRAHPNPLKMNDLLHLSWQMPLEGECSIELLDQQGKRIAMQFEGRLEKGAQSQSVDLSAVAGLKSGTYVIIIKTASSSSSSVIIVK